jgi:RsiW-degrading membrane proteinase PrsW (M82 family)
MINAAAGLLPVVTFLVGLLVLDSFKLLPLRRVLAAVGAGGVAAVASLLLTEGVIQASHLSPRETSRYVAPILEESLKLAFVAIAIRRRRIGFPVDAGIVGFAVGTGFALVENAFFLQALANAGVWLWVVRGFGAAILHGATTAIAAIVSRDLSDRHPGQAVRPFLPGLAAAIVVHAAYNLFVLPPVVATVLLLAVLPPLVFVVYERSERQTHEWVGAGMDLDVELLKLVLSSDFGDTRLGRYLQELKDRFPGPVVADMFCLLRIELELAIRAKGMLLAREAGIEVAPDADLRAKLAELKYLQGSIGRTGLLAIEPLQVSSHRDEWHRFLLQQTR